MKYKKGLWWGFGVGVFVGLAATFLGPSPLIFPVAPIIGVLYVSLDAMFISTDIFVQGPGTGAPAQIIFLVWSIIVHTLVGVGIHAIIHKIRR